VLNFLLILYYQSISPTIQSLISVFFVFYSIVNRQKLSQIKNKELKLVLLCHPFSTWWSDASIHSIHSVHSIHMSPHLYLIAYDTLFYLLSVIVFNILYTSVSYFSDILHLALYIWHCTSDTAHLTLHIWHVHLALYIWHCTHDTVHLALHIWHCTSDTVHLTLYM